jgi:hypothetical protein
VKVLVVDPEQGDLLKARLPLVTQHPRALLTLLEGLALWRGQPLRVVVSATSAGDGRPCWSGSGLFGDELWPGESQLVRYEVADRAPRRRALVGLGDFRSLRIEPRVLVRSVVEPQPLFLYPSLQCSSSSRPRAAPRRDGHGGDPAPVEIPRGFRRAVAMGIGRRSA